MLAEYASEMPYQNNEDCALTFKCPEEKHVIVNVVEYDLEEFSNFHGKCFDYVSIDGQKICGSSIPSFTTTKNKIQALFHSNSDNVSNGFKIQFGCKGIYMGP